MRNIVAGILLASCVFAVSASASIIDYTLTSGDDVITFSAPNQPTPFPTVCAFAPGSCFSLSPVSLTVNGTTHNDGLVDFFLDAVGGGIVIYQGSTLLVDENGPVGAQQLFSGMLAEPTLLTVDATLGGVGGSPLFNEVFHLSAVERLESAEAPEPSTLSMLSVAGLALAGIAFQRSRRSA